MNVRSTFGQTIKTQRTLLGLSLTALAKNIRKENGQSVAPEYLHDIERGRRIPSPHVLGELGRELSLDVHVLSATAGRPLPDVTEYLLDYSDLAPQVAALFARARAAGFIDWDKIVLPKVVE